MRRAGSLLPCGPAPAASGKGARAPLPSPLGAQLVFSSTAPGAALLPDPQESKSCSLSAMQVLWHCLALSSYSKTQPHFTFLDTQALGQMCWAGLSPLPAPGEACWLSSSELGQVKFKSLFLFVFWSTPGLTPSCLLRGHFCWQSGCPVWSWC